MPSTHNYVHYRPTGRFFFWGGRAGARLGRPRDSPPARLKAAASRRAPKRPLAPRQDDGERRAFAGALALRRDGAAVHFDQLLDDGQAEAKAAVLAGLGAALLAEAIEDRGEEGGGDADAGVAHGDGEPL